MALGLLLSAQEMKRAPQSIVEGFNSGENCASQAQKGAATGQALTDNAHGSPKDSAVAGWLHSRDLFEPGLSLSHVC